MPKKSTAQQSMPPDIQLQNLWLSSARSGRYRQQPTQTDLKIRGRYFGLAHLVAVYFWLFLLGLVMALAVWMFA
jgi:hypothetical protein